MFDGVEAITLAFQSHLDKYGDLDCVFLGPSEHRNSRYFNRNVHVVVVGLRRVNREVQ